MNPTSTMTREDEQIFHRDSQQTAERKEARKLHPVLVNWLTTNLNFRAQAPRGSDLVNTPETHPHVVEIRQKTNAPLETAVKMAWCVWRAQQVIFWTRDLAKDTYVKHANGIEELLHRGTDRYSWPEAVQAADAQGDLWEMVKERRARQAAKRAAQQEQEEAVALTLMKIGTDPNSGLGTDLPVAEPETAEMAQTQREVALTGVRTRKGGKGGK